MQSTRRMITTLGSFTLILASLLFYFLILKPSMDKIFVLRGQIQTSLISIGKKQNAITEIKKLFALYQKVSDVRNFVSLSMPIGDIEIDTVIAQVDAISKASKLQLNSMSFEEEVEVKNKTTIEPETRKNKSLFIDVSLFGSYDSLKTFLKSIESNIRLMDVQSIRIDAKDTTLAQQNLYNFDVTFVVYYLADDDQNSGNTNIEPGTGRFR